MKRRLQKIPNTFFTILVLIHTLKSILYETIGSFHYLSTCRDVLENDFQYLTLMQNSLDKGWHQGKPRIEWQPVIEGICSVKIKHFKGLIVVYQAIVSVRQFGLLFWQVQKSTNYFMNEYTEGWILLIVLKCDIQSQCLIKYHVNHSEVDFYF